MESPEATSQIEESARPSLSRRQLLLGCGAVLGGLGGLGGCSSAPKQEAMTPSAGQLPKQVIPFSASPPNGEIPKGWLRSKTWLSTKRTDYKATAYEDQTVLHAVSDESASGLYCDVDISQERAQRIRWRWKVDELIPTADVGKSDLDDAVARVLVSLHENGKKLSFRDMLFREQASLFTGIDLPHSTLLYVWDPKHPVGSVLNINETSRIRYLVVESGPKRLGQWVEYDRDFQADFKMAFDGEASGAVRSVGVTTDANQTFSRAEAWYGDITLGEA